MVTVPGVTIIYGQSPWQSDESACVFVVGVLDPFRPHYTVSSNCNVEKPRIKGVGQNQIIGGRNIGIAGILNEESVG